MEQAPSEKRFVVDSMLGKVAKWLRILGFDTRYERLDTQDQLDVYRREGWFLITRNRQWCGQPRVLCPDVNNPMDQLKLIIAQVPIRQTEVRPLHRCILCNRLLDPLPREAAFDRVPDYVFETTTTFFQCTGCNRVYWAGSHPKRMMERLESVLGWKG